MSESRIPPHDLDIEAAVLSALLLDGELIHIVRPILSKADFYADANGTVYAGMLELKDQGQPIDIVLLADRLRSGGTLERIGGATYLAQLSDATPAISNVEAHSRVIVEKAVARRTIARAAMLQAEGYSGSTPPVELAQRASHNLAKIASGLEVVRSRRIGEIIPEVFGEIQDLTNGGQVAGLETGWKAYDRATNGWAIGKMHVVAGRPGMGKWAFALSAAINVAKEEALKEHPGVVVFISAEMDDRELTQRALAIEAFVSLEEMRGGRVRREDWPKLVAAAAKLKSLPLVFDSKPGADLAHIRSVFQRESRGGTVEIVLGVVDYLQILEGHRGKGQSRESEVSDLSKGLMIMAGVLAVPLLVCSQINRAVESRANQDKRPAISDLRESGSIEQDAYSISLLYRDEYYNADSEWKNSCECIIGKNRGGKPGMVRLAFDAKSTAFRSLSNEYEALGDFAQDGDDWTP